MSKAKKPYAKPSLEKREKLSLITSGVASTAAPPTKGSDERLKTDIHHIGSFEGHKIYAFRYVGDPRVFAGVMAQDLLDNPDHRAAVSMGKDGYYRVDPARLGLHFERIDEMIDAGDKAARILATQYH